MNTNNSKRKLLHTQKVLKKIYNDEFILARQLVHLRTLKGRLRRQEEILLQRLYSEKDITYISAKFHNLKTTEYSKVLHQLKTIQPHELQDIYDFLNNVEE